MMLPRSGLVQRISISGVRHPTTSLHIKIQFNRSSYLNQTGKPGV